METKNPFNSYFFCSFPLTLNINRHFFLSLFHFLLKRKKISSWTIYLLYENEINSKSKYSSCKSLFLKQEKHLFEYLYFASITRSYLKFILMQYITIAVKLLCTSLSVELCGSILLTLKSRSKQSGVSVRTSFCHTWCLTYGFDRFWLFSHIISVKNQPYNWTISNLEF